MAATVSTGYSDSFSTHSFLGFSTAGLAAQSPDEANRKDYTSKPADLSINILVYNTLIPINALLGLTLSNRTHEDGLGFQLAGSYQRTCRNGSPLCYRPSARPNPELAPNIFTFCELLYPEYSSLQTRSGLHAKLDYVFSLSPRINLFSMALQLDDIQHYHMTVATWARLAMCPSATGRGFSASLFSTEPCKVTTP